MLWLGGVVAVDQTKVAFDGRLVVVPVHGHGDGIGRQRPEQDLLAESLRGKVGSRQCGTNHLGGRAPGPPAGAAGGTCSTGRTGSRQRKDRKLMASSEPLETLQLDARAQRRIVAQTGCSADFLIGGNRVRISGNTPFPVESFATIYDQFMEEQDPGVEPDITIHCLLESGPDGSTATLLAGGQAYRLHGAELIAILFVTLQHLFFWSFRVSCG